MRSKRSSRRRPVSVGSFLGTLGGIFWEIVLPILVLAGIGFGLGRRFTFDLDAIGKLLLYVFVPAFNLVRVAEADLTWAQIGRIAAAVLIVEIVLAIPILWVVRRRGIPPGSGAVLVLCSVIFNSGNYGIPLAERAFGKEGGSVQALILMTANLSIWVLGYLLMASGTQGTTKAAVGFVKTPLFWSLVVALLLKGTGLTLPTPVRVPMEYAANGLVPLALITLGAQLAQRVSWPNWRRVAPVMAVKLVAFPLAMAGIVWLFGLWPWPGAMLIVAASAPSAVNVILLALELEGDADLAAACVLWTTIASAFTVTLTLSLVIAAGGSP